MKRNTRPIEPEDHGNNNVTPQAAHIAEMEKAAKMLETQFDSILILGRDEATGLFHCWRGGFHNAIGMAEEFKVRMLHPK